VHTPEYRTTLDIVDIVVVRHHANGANIRKVSWRPLTVARVSQYVNRRSRRRRRRGCVAEELRATIPFVLVEARRRSSTLVHARPRSPMLATTNGRMALTGPLNSTTEYTEKGAYRAMRVATRGECERCVPISNETRRDRHCPDKLTRPSVIATIVVARDRRSVSSREIRDEAARTKRVTSETFATRRGTRNARDAN